MRNNIRSHFPVYISGIGLKINLLLLAMIFICYSCNKQVQVDTPYTSLNKDAVYSTDASAAAVLTGVYADMSAGSFAAGSKGISLRCGLSADEFYGTTTSLGSTLIKYYQNNLDNTSQLTFWEEFYKYLYTINSALDGVVRSSSLTTQVRRQLIGESFFMRGFLYYYLQSMYGKVPLVTTNDYNFNASLPRIDTSLILTQVISDLKNAKENWLSSQYLDPSLLNSSNERVRPTKWAASALLARVYLLNKDYGNAEDEATSIIANYALYDTVPTNSVFLKNSKEAIWQLQPVLANQNTPDGYLFILKGQPTSANPIAISDTLLNSFEPNDKRKGDWLNSVSVGSSIFYYPFKYKIASSTASASEYTMVLRLAEQYLIRAEARAYRGNLSGAIADLNVIRNRAKLPMLNASIGQQAILAAIMHERQVELFSEWGHRWFDLKRTGTISNVMAVITPKKGGLWNSNWQLFPLPITDLNANPVLTQNLGY